ncbi:MAG: ABC transporter permease [Chloroflexota bacterium]
MDFLLRRLIAMIITTALVVVMIFLIFRVIPGDPVLIILGTEAEESQIEALRQKLGTDQPVHVQFLRWVTAALSGDLGESLRFSLPVLKMITDRLAVTLPLAVMAITIVIAVGIPAGVLLALYRNSAIDTLFSLATQLGIAVPSFWAGILLMLLFGVQLGWLPIGTFTSWQENSREAFRSLILPAVAVALPPLAIVVRYVRNGFIDQWNQDYVRTAMSKGLANRVIVYRHVLRNTLIPVITVLGIIFADIVSGTLVVEQVFALPGIGRLLVTAVGYRDFPLLQGLALYIALVVIGLNFGVDLAYRWVDPRIRLN